MSSYKIPFKWWADYFGAQIINNFKMTSVLAQRFDKYVSPIRKERETMLGTHSCNWLGYSCTLKSHRRLLLWYLISHNSKTATVSQIKWALLGLLGQPLEVLSLQEKQVNPLTNQFLSVRDFVSTIPSQPNWEWAQVFAYMYLWSLVSSVALFLIQHTEILQRAWSLLKSCSVPGSSSMFRSSL